MKYCTKCGAQMVDDALFCPRCGTRVAPIVEENKEPVYEEPVSQEAPKKANKAVKGQAKPAYEQTLKEFLPISLVIFVCQLALWIVQALAHPTDILRFMPLIIFTLIGGTYGFLNFSRALQCYKRQIYFKAALSLVLSVALFTCVIINIIKLIGG